MRYYFQYTYKFNTFSTQHVIGVILTLREHTNLAYNFVLRFLRNISQKLSYDKHVSDNLILFLLILGFPMFLFKNGRAVWESEEVHCKSFPDGLSFTVVNESAVTPGYAHVSMIKYNYIFDFIVSYERFHDF